MGVDRGFEINMRKKGRELVQVLAGFLGLSAQGQTAGGSGVDELPADFTQREDPQGLKKVREYSGKNRRFIHCASLRSG